MSGSEKYVRSVGTDVYLGELFQDGSHADLIRLYTDVNNIFQIEILQGSNVAYRFLGECDELFDVMRNGIVGVKIQTLGEILKNMGFRVMD